MEIQGGQSRYAIINYLKGFSILTIVVMHLLQMYPIPVVLGKLSSLGGTGVHIFFFCSGFGLCLSQCRKELTYLEFIKKRFLKIYLPYIAVVIILFLIPFTFEGEFYERLIALTSHIFLFKMFIPSLEGSFSYPLWYMSTLFQFYLLFIVLYNFKKKIGKRNFLVVCVIISVFWWLFVGYTGLSEERVWGSFFLQYLWEFALGMYIAERLNSGENIKLKKNWLALIGIGGLVVGGVLGIKGGMLKAFNDFFLAFGYGAMALLISEFVKIYNIVCIKVNNISYELYLVHATCFSTIKYMLKDSIPNLVLMIISLIFSFVVALIYHTMIKVINKHD